jgi:hypothetical protein
MAQTVYRHPGACFALFVRNPFARPAFIDLYSERTGRPTFWLRLIGSVPLYMITKGLGRIVGFLRTKLVKAQK